MISIELRIFLSIALLLYFMCIFIFLRKRALSLKYSLIWIFSGVAMILLVVFPQIIYFSIDIIGMKSPVNGLFAFIIFLMLILLMSITSIVSKHSEKMKDLIQYNAFLEKRIRELEDNITSK